MVRAQALPLSGDAGIGDIRDMIANDRLPRRPRHARHVSTRDILPRLHRKGDVVHRPVGRSSRSTSCSTPAAAWPAWWRRSSSIGCPARTTRLCFEIDGTFPNHEANPLIEENRRDITAEVIRQKADVGIAWDGDADRCFFIDGSGEFISGDFVTALLAEAFLLKHPGATVIYDLRASHAVKDIAARYGGKALMNRVGHAFIKQRMRAGGWHLRRRSDRPLLLPRFLLRRQRFHPGAADPRADVEEEQVAARPAAAATASSTSSPARSTPSSKSMDEVPAKLAAIEARYRTPQIAKMDGVSVDYPDWHFNVRASNTEPLLRLNLEATHRS